MSSSLASEAITALGAHHSESQHQSHAPRATDSIGACHFFYRAEAAGHTPCIAKQANYPHIALLLGQGYLSLLKHQINPWRFASSPIIARSQQFSLSEEPDSKFFVNFPTFHLCSTWLEKYFTISLLACWHLGSKGTGGFRKVKMNQTFSSKNDVMYLG